MTYAEFLAAVQKKAEEKWIAEDNVLGAHLHVEGKGVIQIGLTQPVRTRVRK